ncbi:queuosine precursor transporter [bacterium]|jgi:queuosine precursor transporter|nr:queuosine precursor transporter [bacterium]
MNTFLFLLHSVAIGISLLGAVAYRKELVISLICLMAVLSNLFVVKQIDLFGYSVTCADIFSVGIGLGLNLLQEYWGKSIAKKTIWISFICSIFYLCMTQFHCAYIPNSYDTTSKAFNHIMQYAPRIITASFISYLISQHFDCYIFGLLKQWFSNRFFILRNYGSLVLSQLLDTVLFSFLGLYKIAGNIIHIIIVSFFIKVIVIVFSTPIVAFAKKVVTKEEITENE